MQFLPFEDAGYCPGWGYGPFLYSLEIYFAHLMAVVLFLKAGGVNPTGFLICELKLLKITVFVLFPPCTGQSFCVTSSCVLNPYLTFLVFCS